MENSLFTVTNEDLRRLGADEAVELVSELLWAEGTRLGIPISNIQISAEVYTADGGIDAEVSNQVVPGDLIRVGHTAYQIKSGENFEPQREQVIREELFGDKKTSGKENLKRRVRECLDKDGTYVLVCTGIDLVDRSIPEGHLRKLLVECGYSKPKVEVWLQNQLRGFLTKYPSIALRVNRREAGSLRAHNSWAAEAEMNLALKPGVEQEKLISNLRAALRQSGSAVHTHLRGEAGIGKTRLVLEATREVDLQPLVLYTNRPARLLEEQFLMTLTREDNPFTVVLIVDECSFDYRTQIWNRLKTRGQRIKLVTIYNEFEDSAGGPIFDAPPLERDAIIEIIGSYGIIKDEAARFADFCSGSPRVAHVLGLNLERNPNDLLKPPDTIDVWSRYVAGADDPASAAVNDRLIVLRYLALFKRFGHGQPVAAEAKSISAMIEKDHGIKWGKFSEIVAELRKRKILQGETTLYITPKLLHIWLWTGWWEIYGRGFQLEEFIRDFQQTLLPWFFEMFRYAAESPVARNQVKFILGPDGPFRDRAFLNSQLGGDFFLALTDVDAPAALVCLQRALSGASLDELLEFTNGRRPVIWALEKIAIWKDLFTGAAELLLRLAEAENETWSNNATGVFAELFSPGYGDVAPSEASPQERFPVLEKALKSQSERLREIALKACAEALETSHFSRMVGAEHQGLKLKPKLWMPKTYGEVWGAYRLVWTLLRSSLPTLAADQRQSAVETLFEKGIGIAATTNLGPLVLETWREILNHQWATKAEILEHLLFFLRYRRSELSPEVLKTAEGFRDELVGTDFSSKLKRYVGIDLLDDEFDDYQRTIDSRDKTIRSLAEKCLARPELLKPELKWLVTEEAKNGYKFGFELGKGDKDRGLLKEIVEAQRSFSAQSNPFFLGGYLRAIFETAQDTWEELLDAFASDDQMRRHVPELTWRSGMTDRAAVRILSLAEGGQMETKQFGMFTLGSVMSGVSEPVFRRWAEFLVIQPERTGVNILINLLHFYYADGKVDRKLPADLAFRALSHPAFFQKGGKYHTMERYHWAEVAIAFAEVSPKESLKLAEIIVEHFGEEDTILGRFDPHTQKVLMEITKQNPGEVWHLVADRLGPPFNSRAFSLKSWLHGDKHSPGGERGVLPLVPLEEIWKWVDQDPNTRAWYLASFVPKQLFRSAETLCLAREVLIRYGSDPRVRSNLMANFSTEGWFGPSSAHYQGKKEFLLNFSNDETNQNVKLWIDEYVGSLERQIDDARVREEREAF